MFLASDFFTFLPADLTTGIISMAPGFPVDVLLDPEPSILLLLLASPVESIIDMHRLCASRRRETVDCL